MTKIVYVVQTKYKREVWRDSFLDKHKTPEKALARVAGHYRKHPKSPVKMRAIKRTITEEEL